MTAAIYCRKSTTQDVSDEQRSVARQEEHARVYAARELAGQGATSPATVSETNWLAFARQSYDMVARRRADRIRPSATRRFHDLRRLVGQWQGKEIRRLPRREFDCVVT